ncbi:MAG: HIT family protein [Candidatus Saccharimonadales bacterium]
MGSCEICPILASRNDGQDALVLQTEYWRVVLDSDQRVLGKCFVTLLEHKESLSDLTDIEWQDLHAIMQQLEAGARRVFAPSHFNWSCLMNNAVVAGQPTHIHWHMHPRYTQAVEFAGQLFHDTELYPPKQRTTHAVSPAVLLQIAQVLA